jgi:uncharacterized membrane protein
MVTGATAAMPGIYAEAHFNAPFLVLLFGAPLVAIPAAVIACSVPEQLAALDPVGLSAATAAEQWQAYLGPWTAWNHVRTAAPLLASTLLLIGVRYR